MLDLRPDDRPFGGADPSAAMFYYSRDRKGEHPQGHLAGYAGIVQADAYDGYNQLYLAGRQPGPIREAPCWSHGRRPFFAMADFEDNARRKITGKKKIPLSPIASEVARKIDALFEIERLNLAAGGITHRSQDGGRHHRDELLGLAFLFVGAL